MKVKIDKDVWYKFIEELSNHECPDNGFGLEPFECLERDSDDSRCIRCWNKSLKVEVEE